jgi:hypothetical protein
MPVDERLARRLVQLAGVYRAEIPLTQDDLADLVLICPGFPRSVGPRAPPGCGWAAVHTGEWHVIAVAHALTAMARP